TFVVPPNTPGLSQGQKFSKHGIRASHTAEVILDQVRVPGSCLLGGKEKLAERLARAREGQKSKGQPARQTFGAPRPSVGAMAVGCARAAYEYALEYSTQREQFGKPIGDNQAVAFILAEMATRIDAARLLVWRASWMARNDKDFANAEGSMSKLYASETATFVTQNAVRILGGNGYTREYPVERWHRDATIFTIFEGASEIQKLIIGRQITGLPIRSAPEQGAPGRSAPLGPARPPWSPETACLFDTLDASTLPLRTLGQRNLLLAHRPQNPGETPSNTLSANCSPCAHG